MEKRLSVIFKFPPVPFSGLLVIFVILPNFTISQGAVYTVCWSFSRFSQILQYPSVPCAQHAGHFPDFPIFPISKGAVCTACWSLSRFSHFQACRVHSLLVTFAIFLNFPISKGAVCLARSLSQFSQIYLFPRVSCAQPGHFPDYPKFSYFLGYRLHSQVTFPIFPSLPMSAVYTAWSLSRFSQISLFPRVPCAQPGLCGNISQDKD